LLPIELDGTELLGRLQRESETPLLLVRRDHFLDRRSDELRHAELALGGQGDDLSVQVGVDTNRSYDR
jgi:hypothetical protein